MTFLSGSILHTLFQHREIINGIVCENRFLKSQTMLRWAAIFFVIAIIAAIFGFGGIAAGAASIAKVLFFIFIVLLVLTLLFGSMIFKK